MNDIETSDVAKSDINPIQHTDQKAIGDPERVETEVSFDLSFWKLNLKGLFRRVSGRKP